MAIPTDFTDGDAREALVSRTRSELGDVDLLINNAGILHAGRIYRMTGVSRSCAASD